jgi:hypothetical protein
MGETAVLLVDNVLEVPPLVTPDEPAQPARWVPYFGALAERVIGCRQVLPSHEPPAGKRWMEVTLGDAARALGDAQGPGRIVADASGDKPRGSRTVAEEPVAVGSSRLPRRFPERVRVPKAHVQERLARGRWEDPPGQVQAAFVHCRNAARKAGWDFDEDEVYDPLPIQASTVVYDQDWTSLNHGDDVTLLPEWGYVGAHTCNILKLNSGFADPTACISPYTSSNWTSATIGNVCLGGKPDQQLVTLLDYPNVYAAGPTNFGLRCSVADGWGYYSYIRYRNAFELHAGSGLLLGSTLSLASQTQTVTLQAQGTSIYLHSINIGTGEYEMVVGPVTDTYRETAGDGSVWVYLVRVSTPHGVHRFTVTDLAEAAAGGWRHSVLASGRYI